ncbi:hypothetical protein [Pseudomonas sp. 31 R 17]|nr:hypothetical protein [Pseudomonas sp. 31 R 17]
MEIAPDDVYLSDHLEDVIEHCYKKLRDEANQSQMVASSQTWLALPASGIEEVGHGSSTAGRALGQNCQEARGECRRGIEAQVRPGTRKALADLMKWSGITEQGEAMTLMIHHLHALGSVKCQPLLNPPRHEIEISQNVAREFRNKSLLAIQKDHGNEIIEPE